MKKAFVFLISAVFFVILLGVFPYLAVQKIGTGHRFSPLSENYYSDGEGIYFLPKDNSIRADKVYLDVDAGSFEVLSKKLAKDKDKVYCNSNVVDGVDAQSFKMFGGEIPMDKNHAYDEKFVGYNSYEFHPSEIDVNSIQQIGRNWFKDKDSLYYFSRLSPYLISHKSVSCEDGEIKILSEDENWIRVGNKVFNRFEFVTDSIDIQKVKQLRYFYYLANDSIYINYTQIITKEDYKESLKPNVATKQTDWGTIIMMVIVAGPSIILGAFFLLLAIIIIKIKNGRQNKK